MHNFHGPFDSDDDEVEADGLWEYTETLLTEEELMAEITGEYPEPVGPPPTDLSSPPSFDDDDIPF